ncbi:hypothetical protein ACNOYE_39005 [Nannocystaceae bacterium ST9]
MQQPGNRPRRPLRAANRPRASFEARRTGEIRPLAWGLAALAFGVIALAPWPALAGPGVANRLAGADAQGPATESVTAIYHNPAMLGSLPGLHFQTTLRGGVDHLSVRRFGIDTDGTPTKDFGSWAQVANPAFDYFVGISFLLDPIAIGAAVHTFDSRYRIYSDPSLRYHMAGEDDLGCTIDRSRVCPDLRKGGNLEMRTDLDVSLAWNALDFMSVGATLHVPRSRTYFARDVDSVLTGVSEGAGCDPASASVENPICAERLSFRGSTRLRWFGLQPNGSRLDIALTLGVAFVIRNKLTIGIRYRTQPLLNQGRLTLNGKAAVCVPNSAAEQRSDLPSCDTAGAIDATLTEVIPRELAIGFATGFGNWQLDTNLYWIDRCPGFDPSGACSGKDGRQLRLTGLDQDASTLPDSTIYRGRADIFGAELWTRYRMDDAIGANLPWNKVLCSGKEASIDPSSRRRARCIPRVDLLLGAGFNSPGVKPGALTAAANDGWTVMTSFGTSFNLPTRNGTWSLVPAYALDLMVPTRVGPGGASPAFDPAAGIAFEQGGADLNSSSAATVLQGRALPTNAGVYTGAVHSVLFALRWSERGFGSRDPRR